MADRRLLNAFNSSSLRQHSNPELNALLLSGGAALSELLNTQRAQTQVETPKDSTPKWVMGQDFILSFANLVDLAFNYL